MTAATALRLAVLALAATGCSVDLPAAAPTCSATEVMTLMAQAVPTADEIPCLQEVPPGWSVVDFEGQRGSVRFTLSHAVAGDHALEVHFAASCLEVDHPLTVAPGHVEGALRESDDRLTGYRHRGLVGGCVSQRLDVPADGGETFLEDIDRVLTTTVRAQITQGRA